MQFPTLPNGMNVVDRNQLYTDLHYRVAYVSDFMGFADADKQAIAQSYPYMQPLIPGLVDAVYVHLLQYNITASYFLNRMSGYDDRVTTQLDKLDVASDQIQFRKAMLRKYLEKAITGMTAPSIIQYLNWVALIHTSNSKKSTPSLHVEYVHCHALMAFVNTAVLNAIHLHVPSDMQIGTQLAFTKLFWLQMDLFSLYYVRDGLELPNHLAYCNQVNVPVVSPDRVDRYAFLHAAILKGFSLIGVGTVSVVAVFGLNWLITRK